MGQLAPGRRKIIFLADFHSVCIAGSTTHVKEEHYLHRNVWKMGMVHKRNVVTIGPKMKKSIDYHPLKSHSSVDHSTYVCAKYFVCDVNEV